jgi:CheY-like chemotaxis protein
MLPEGHESVRDRLAPVGGSGRPHETNGRAPPGGVQLFVPEVSRVLRVLVVDDDRDTADSMALLLRLWGHQVGVEYGGARALEAAAASPPDVLLLDLAMAGVDGNRVAQQLRCQTRFLNTLIVGISGYADEAHRLSAARSGFDDYLVKPVDLEALQQRLLLERERQAALERACCAAARADDTLLVGGAEAVRRGKGKLSQARV